MRLECECTGSRACAISRLLGDPTRRSVRAHGRVGCTLSERWPGAPAARRPSDGVARSSRIESRLRRAKLVDHELPDADPGTDALIQSGAGTVVDVCELVDAEGPVSRAELRRARIIEGSDHWHPGDPAARAADGTGLRKAAQSTVQGAQSGVQCLGTHRFSRGSEGTWASILRGLPCFSASIARGHAPSETWAHDVKVPTQQPELASSRPPTALARFSLPRVRARPGRSGPTSAARCSGRTPGNASLGAHIRQARSDAPIQCGVAESRTATSGQVCTTTVPCRHRAQRKPAFVGREVSG